jgi:hypothetical protein
MSILTGAYSITAKTIEYALNNIPPGIEGSDVINNNQSKESFIEVSIIKEDINSINNEVSDNKNIKNSLISK